MHHKIVFEKHENFKYLHSMISIALATCSLFGILIFNTLKYCWNLAKLLPPPPGLSSYFMNTALKSTSDKKTTYKKPNSGRPAILKYCIGYFWKKIFINSSYTPPFIKNHNAQTDFYLLKMWVFFLNEVDFKR